MRPHSLRTIRRALAAMTTLLVLSTGAVILAATPSAAAATPGLLFGAYASGYSGSGSQLPQFESQLGSKVAIASSFRGWGDIFPDPAQKQDAATGHRLLIAWDLGSTAATRFTTFTSHAHDRYLGRAAAAARAFGKTFYVRPWAEMNGDWSAFQPTPNGARPAGGTYPQFVAAWRYVVRYFRGHGASNVRWVFNPTTDTYAETTPAKAIWPGRSYVDVLGLDGYNWGTGGIFTWRTFSQIYAAQYRHLIALAPYKPVWICEFGSKEPAVDDGAPVDATHTKAQWYADALTYLRTTATHVKAAVLFDVHKERDWRVASDAAALRVVGGAARTAVD